MDLPNFSEVFKKYGIKATLESMIVALDSLKRPAPYLVQLSADLKIALRAYQDNYEKAKKVPEGKS